LNIKQQQISFVILFCALNQSSQDNNIIMATN